MPSYRDIIDCWPRYADLAEELNVTTASVKQMRHRDKIPPCYWEQLVEAGHKWKVSGLSLDLLARIERHRGERMRA